MMLSINITVCIMTDIKDNTIQDSEKEVCIVVAGSVDSGKCHAAGTLVIKHDGKLIKVEDIKVGDKLMGDDSTERTVIEIHSGEGQLYEIIQENEKSYVVNGNHILCLKYFDSDHICYDKTDETITIKYAIFENNLPVIKIETISTKNKSEYCFNQEARKYIEMISLNKNKLNYGDIVEISVLQYLTLPLYVQNSLKWYRVEVTFPYKEVPFDEYILGVHLGNNVNSSRKNYIKHDSFSDFIQKYNLINNDHIPDIYKYNSREIRLNILAGLIDSCGQYCHIKNMYSFELSRRKWILINDILYLVRSLGFTTVICHNDVINDKYKFNFWGKNQELIPCRFSKNKATNLENDNLVCTIKIKQLNVGKYYGFSLNNNKRFLLEDFSVSHNSSTLGVLTSGVLDDGKGLARDKVAKHPHEIKTGKTSDISTHTLFHDNKKVVLVDLCGHEKYLKTTLYGVTGFFPDYGILIVSANRGFLKMTKEHMGIFIRMKIPFVILVTRVDITPQNIYEDVMDTAIKFLNHSKRKNIIINKYPDFEEDKTKQKLEYALDRLNNNPYTVPIISISNKTGYYINSVKHLLINLNPRQVWSQENINSSIFYIDGALIPSGIGLVVTGLLKGKTITADSELYIGPYGNEFKRVNPWSFHDNYKNKVSYLVDRQRGCVAIKPFNKKDEINKDSIKKGMILTTKENITNICNQFSAEVEILNHPTVISNNYIPIIHCGTVRQAAKIILNENETLQSGDKKIVSFRFIQHPEFIEPETTFFFREGTTRGVGTVKSILPVKDDPNPKIIRQKKRQKRSRRDRNIKIIQ